MHLAPLALAWLLCAAPATPAPAAGSEPAARALLERFLAPGADAAALTRALRPAPADFAAVFEPAAAARAEKGYRAAWDQGQIVVRPGRTQTAIEVLPITSDDLKAGRFRAHEHPAEWSKVAPFLKRGGTLYRFRFLDRHGLALAFDGLVFVNGRWALFPMPWRALGVVR